jgi:hypothetical protein
VIIGEVYKHLKTGGFYNIVCPSAWIEKTMEEAVVYRNMRDGRIWVRPKSEFLDGRFEKAGTMTNNILT